MTQSSRAAVRSSWAWVLLWAVFSIVPVIPYTFPLFQQSLSNSPTAYLIWIPVMAFFWAGWSFHQMPAQHTQSAQSTWLAVFLCLGTGFLLYASMEFWPHWAIPEGVGLLLWPFWALFMFWILFGWRSLRRVINPLLYLFLVWPPLYLKIIGIVNPGLAYITVHMVYWFARQTNWVHMRASSTLLDVHAPGDWVTIQISNACSGSDSVLALLVLFPVMLVLFRTSFIQKVMMVVGGAVLAFLFNVIRIWLIIAGLHWFGYRFAFDILHPVLGSVFFVLIIVVLLYFGSRRAVSHPVATVPIAIHPGRLRAGLAAVLTAGLTVSLFPLYLWSVGSELNPLFVSTTDLASLLPTIPSYRHRVSSQANLHVGPKSDRRSLSEEYASASGNKVVVHLTWTNRLSQSVAGPGHPLNAVILMSQTVVIRPGLLGTSYLVRYVNPAQPSRSTVHVDTIYPLTVVHDAQRSYLRVENSATVDGGALPDSVSTIEREFRSGVLPASTNSAGVKTRFTRYDAFVSDFIQEFVRANGISGLSGSE